MGLSLFGGIRDRVDEDSKTGETPHIKMVTHRRRHWCILSLRSFGSK